MHGKLLFPWVSQADPKQVLLTNQKGRAEVSGYFFSCSSRIFSIADHTMLQGPQNLFLFFQFTTLQFLKNIWRKIVVYRVGMGK